MKANACVKEVHGQRGYVRSGAQNDEELRTRGHSRRLSPPAWERHEQRNHRNTEYHGRHRPDRSAEKPAKVIVTDARVLRKSPAAASSMLLKPPVDEFDECLRRVGLVGEDGDADRDRQARVRHPRRHRACGSHGNHRELIENAERARHPRAGRVAPFTANAARLQLQRLRRSRAGRSRACERSWSKPARRSSATAAMSPFRWPRSPSHDGCFRKFCG